MTIAVGLVCSDGVIIASDSMASSGNVAVHADKVYRLDHLPVVWSASGSVYVIEEVEQHLRLGVDGPAGDGSGEGPVILDAFTRLVAIRHFVAKAAAQADVGKRTLHPVEAAIATGRRRVVIDHRCATGESCIH